MRNAIIGLGVLLQELTKQFGTDWLFWPGLLVGVLVVAASLFFIGDRLFEVDEDDFSTMLIWFVGAIAIGLGIAVFTFV